MAEKKAVQLSFYVESVSLQLELQLEERLMKVEYVKREDSPFAWSFT